MQIYGWLIFIFTELRHYMCYRDWNIKRFNKIKVFTIYMCFYQDMTKRCQNLVSLGSYYGKTVLDVYSSPLCFVRYFRNQTISATRNGLVFYVCTINMTDNRKNLMTYEVWIPQKCIIFRWEFTRSAVLHSILLIIFKILKLYFMATFFEIVIVTLK